MTNTARSRLNAYYGVEDEYEDVIISKILSGDCLLQKRNGSFIHCLVYLDLLDRLIHVVYSRNDRKIITVSRAYKNPAPLSFLYYAEQYLKGQLRSKQIFNKVVRAYRSKLKKPNRARFMDKKIQSLSTLQEYIEKTRDYYGTQ